MNKVFFTFLSLALALIGCTSINQVGAEVTPSPTLNYTEAIQSFSATDIKNICKKYLEPLGDPPFSSTLAAVDETQNPGTIHATIYPAYQVHGKPNTTVQFGPDNILPTAYRTIGNKVYLLNGSDRINTTNIVLKQNDNIIGYLAEFEVVFDLKGQPQSIKELGCSPIKDQDTNQ